VEREHHLVYQREVLIKEAKEAWRKKQETGASKDVGKFL
jgi:hypothetical protein